MATQNWPGTKPELAEFAAGKDYADSLVAANRSQFDEEMDIPPTEARMAPLRRRQPVALPVGRRGLLHKLWLILRDTWIYIAGPSALVRVKRRGRK